MKREANTMIIYKESLEGIAADQLGGFFESWDSPPTPETHLRMLRGSDRVVLALDDTTGRVVGFVAATTDGVMSAYISFLEVLPAYRKQRIGDELMRRMLAQFRHLYMIDLVCYPQQQSFYARFGMVKADGASVRNEEYQSGGSLL